MTLKELLPLIDLECEIYLDCDLWDVPRRYESRAEIPTICNSYKVVNITADKWLQLWIDIAIKE